MQTSPQHSASKGLCFLLAAQSMVGLNIVASKYLVATIPILFLLVLRFGLAAFILLPLHWLKLGKQTTAQERFSDLTKTDWFFIIAQALCAGVFFNCLMLWGLHYTDANVAGIITSALPAIIAIMACLILGERISAKTLLCILFATLGLLVIAFNKFNGLEADHSFFGDFIVLLSLLPEATYYILAKLHVKRLPIFLLSSLLNAINALVLLPCLLFSSFSLLEINAEQSFILFFLGLSAGLFYVFWYFGSQQVDGLMASLCTAAMPITTVLFAWLLLGEQLTYLECLGMSFVILSIALYAIRS